MMADLKYHVIEGETFAGHDFSKGSAKAITYSRCLFKSCLLIGTDLRNMRFEGCSFIGCQLSNAKFEGCRFQDVKFNECKIVGGEFHKCDKTFFSAEFKNCLLDCCNFSDRTMKKGVFSSCKVRECYFTGTTMPGADFSGSDLSGTVFHECDLSHADFSTASHYHIDPRTNKIKKAKFALPEAVGLLQAFDIIIC